MMSFDLDRHHRRSIRMKEYDYTRGGAYFVTVCTQDRACLFGDVVHGEMWLNTAGRVAEQCWLDIPHHFPDVRLDAFVIMPNHVHGIIIIIDDTVGAKNFSPLPAHIVPGTPVPPGRHPPCPAHIVPGTSVPPGRHPSRPEHIASGTPVPSGRHPSCPENILPLRIRPNVSRTPMMRSPSKTVGSIVRGFKIGVTTWFRQKTDGFPVWQRNYYEHIIRTEASLNRIRRYIAENPLRWELDKENPAIAETTRPRADHGPGEED